MLKEINVSVTAGTDRQRLIDTLLASGIPVEDVALSDFSSTSMSLRIDEDLLDTLQRRPEITQVTGVSEGIAPASYFPTYVARNRQHIAVPIARDVDTAVGSFPDPTKYDVRPLYDSTESQQEQSIQLGYGRQRRWLGSHFMSYSQYVDSTASPLNRLEGGVRGTFGIHADDNLTEADLDARYVAKYFGRNVDIVALEAGDEFVQLVSDTNSGLERHPDLQKTPDVSANHYDAISEDSLPSKNQVNIAGNHKTFDSARGFGDAPFGNYDEEDTRFKFIDWPGSRNASNGAGTVFNVVSIVDDIVTLDRPLKDLALSDKLVNYEDVMEVTVTAGSNPDINAGLYKLRPAPRVYTPLENQPTSMEIPTHPEFTPEGEWTGEYVPRPDMTTFNFSQPHGVENGEFVKVQESTGTILPPEGEGFVPHKPEDDPLSLPKLGCAVHTLNVSQITISKFAGKNKATFRLKGVGTASDVSKVVVKLAPSVNAQATKNAQYQAGDRATQGVFTNHSLQTLSVSGGRFCGFAKSANLHIAYKSDNIFPGLIEWHKNKPINPETGEKNPTIVVTEFQYCNSQKKNFFPLDTISSITHRGKNILKPSGGWGSNLRVFTDMGLIPFRIEDPQNAGTWMWTIPMGRGYEDTRLKDSIESLWDAGIVVCVTAGNGGDVYVKRDDPDYEGTRLNIADGSTYFYAQDDYEAADGVGFGTTFHSWDIRTAVADNTTTNTQTFFPFQSRGPYGCRRNKSIDIAAGQNSETYPVLDYYTTRGPGIDIVGSGSKHFALKGAQDGTEWQTETYEGSGSPIDPNASQYQPDYYFNTDYPFTIGETLRIDDIGIANSNGVDANTQWHTYLETTPHTDWTDLVAGGTYTITDIGTGSQYENMMADRQQEWNDLLGTSGVTYAVGDTVTIPDNPGNSGNGGVGSTADRIYARGDLFTLQGPYFGDGTNRTPPKNSTASKQGWRYGTYGGTSCAGPTVVGKLACLMEQYKNEYGYWPTNDAAKEVLLAEAKNVVRGYDSVDWSNTPAAGPNIINNGTTRNDKENILSNPKFMSDYIPGRNVIIKTPQDADNLVTPSDANWTGYNSARRSFNIGNGQLTLGTARNQVQQIVVDKRDLNNPNDDLLYTSNIWNSSSSILTYGFRSPISSAVPETQAVPMSGEAVNPNVGNHTTKVAGELISTTFSPQPNTVVYKGPNDSGFGKVGWKWYDYNGTSIGNNGFGSLPSETIIDARGANRIIRDMWWTKGNPYSGGILCFSLSGPNVPNTSEVFSILEINGVSFKRTDANYSSNENGNSAWWWNISTDEYNSLGNSGTKNWSLLGKGLKKIDMTLVNNHGNEPVSTITSFDVESGKEYFFLVETPSHPIRLELGSASGLNDYFNVTSSYTNWTSTVTGTVHLKISRVSGSALGDNLTIGPVHVRRTTFSELVTAAPRVLDENGNWPSNDGYGTASGLHRNYVSNFNGWFRFTELAGTTTKRAFHNEGSGLFRYFRRSGGGGKTEVIVPDTGAVYPAQVSVVTDDTETTTNYKTKYPANHSFGSADLNAIEDAGDS